MPLGQALDQVHDAVLKLQAQQNKTGIMLTQAQVQLTLSAQKTATGSFVLGVTLPITANATVSDSIQATRGNQITFTFASFLTLPTNSIGWAAYTGNTPTHVQQTETDTGGKDGPITKSTTTDTTTPNKWDLTEFRTLLEKTGSFDAAFR